MAVSGAEKGEERSNRHVPSGAGLDLRKELSKQDVCALTCTLASFTTAIRSNTRRYEDEQMIHLSIQGRSRGKTSVGRVASTLSPPGLCSHTRRCSRAISSMTRRLRYNAPTRRPNKNVANATVHTFTQLHCFARIPPSSSHPEPDIADAAFEKENCIAEKDPNARSMAAAKCRSCQPRIISGTEKTIRELHARARTIIFVRP